MVDFYVFRKQNASAIKDTIDIYFSSLGICVANPIRLSTISTIIIWKQRSTSFASLAITELSADETYIIMKSLGARVLFSSFVFNSTCIRHLPINQNSCIVDVKRQYPHCFIRILCDAAGDVNSFLYKSKAVEIVAAGNGGPVLPREACSYSTSM